MNFLQIAARVALIRLSITYKSAPEYASIEDFVQYLIDDERDTYTADDLQALNYRLKRPVAEIRKELAGYGLKLAPRGIENKGRGYNSNDLDRWTGPGSSPTHGGSGFSNFE